MVIRVRIPLGPLNYTFTQIIMDISKKDVYQTIRVALTGNSVSPDLVSMMLILGREETLERLRIAREHIEQFRT